MAESDPENLKALMEELLFREEAVRIQNRVVEGSMEAAGFWRAKAMYLLNREAREAFSDEN